MKKIKKLVLHEASHVLSSDAMLSLFGGAPHLLIYSCVCSKEGFPNKNGTVKVFPKDNPETSILRLDENVMDILVQAVLLVHLYSSYSTFAMLVC